jgi:hypothetical protein
MIITNETGLPQAIVDAIVNDGYSAGRSDISVTTLINPVRQRVLKKRYSDRITEDAADRIWALFGQAIHTILERAHTVFSEGMAEQRLYAEVNGWTLGGQFDRLCLLDGGTIQDYKVSSVWAALDGTPKPEWVSQLNCLAWLARRRGIKVSRLEIVLLCRDWSASKAKGGGNYPPRPVVRIPVTVWPDAETTRYIDERIRRHQAAEALDDDNLPFCSDEEVWRSASVYAVRKPGRKSAVKLYAIEADATAHAAELGATHYVQHRPGRAVRCADYCPVSAVCNQFQAELAAAGGDGDIEAGP